MVAFDPATLELIRIDYEESTLTVAAIGDKFGVTAQYISRLARKHGWKLRTQQNRRAPRVKPPPSYVGRALIAHRLCGVINKKIDQMEKDMESGELSSADLERDAKTISSMIGGMEKVTHGPAEDKVSKPDVARSAAVDANVDEVERLQREIIQRFERIEQRRQAERGSA